MPSYAAYVRLVRPLNLLITILGVLLGGALSAGADIAAVPLPDLLLACASAVLIAAGGNCINDVFDIDVDRINRPDRPLSSGRVSLSAARLTWFATTILGLAVAAMVSLAHFLIALVAAALLYMYSARLKRVPVAGNLAVSVVVGLALVFGGWTTGAPGQAYVGAGFAVLTTFAREVIKDIEDVEGDRSVGAMTIPLAFGLAAARRTACGALILTVVLTPLPFLVMDYGPLFLFLVLAADLMLLRSMWLLPAIPEDAADASAWIKGAMAVGIAALFAA